MTTQFISTNKNYKRLFNAPLDSTLSWESESALREYLKDPTCYINQIVGCLGKAYIVIDKNGVKDIKEIGTLDENNNIVSKIEKQLLIGGIVPTNEEVAWIDTSDINNGYTDNVSDLVINEFREMFNHLQSQIIELKQKNYELETRIEIIETNGGGGGGTEPDIPNITDDSILTLEDGTILTFEDGSILIFEKNSSSTTNDNIMTFENGDVMTFEDNSIMILEK